MFRRFWLIVTWWFPFGLLSRSKPRHFREMFRILWLNRGRWLYALRILRHGVCDGCSLGTTGLKDEVLPGLHLCLTRLSLLRLNTMPAIPSALFEDVTALERLSNEQLHQLGRLPYPLLRDSTENRFRRISWDEATERVASALNTAAPSGTCAERTLLISACAGVLARMQRATETKLRRAFW